MNQNQALVVSVQGEYAWVEVPERMAACGNCQHSWSCPTGLLDNDKEVRRYRIANRINAVPGETVILHVAKGTLWRASSIAYLLPAVLAISAAALGQSLAADPGALMGVLFGLVAGFAYLRRIETKGNSVLPLLSIRRLSTS